MIRDLIKNDASLALIIIKELGVLHLIDKIIILIGSLDIFVEECTSYASLQDQNGLWIFVSHFST